MYNLKKELKQLTLSQIKEMSKAGFDFYHHTYNLQKTTNRRHASKCGSQWIVQPIDRFFEENFSNNKASLSIIEGRDYNDE